MKKQAIISAQGSKPVGPYSPGIVWERLLFTSGQLGTDPATGKPAEGGVREQTIQALKNLQALIEAAGSDLNHVLKTTCFLVDLKDFAIFNEAYKEFFPETPPARSTVQAGLLSSYLVEIEAIVALPTE